MAHIDASPRISTSTLNKYLRVRVEPIFRKSVLMGMLKSKGRITYNNDGMALNWRPRFKRRSITAGDGNPVSIAFPRTNTRMEVTLPWRQYQLGESVTKYEKLVGQSKETALFKIADEAVKEMMDDFTEDFRLKLYVDGNATATNKDIHGLESMFSVSAADSTQPIGLPNDTYAGKATTLAALGGDWDTTNTWPTGTGDVEYHAWSPLVVDVNHSTWTLGSGETRVWRSTWQQAIRYGTTYLGLLQKTDPDVLLLSADWLRIAKDSLEDTERFVLTSKSGLTDIGFKTLQFEGLEIATEYGIPAETGYLLSWDAMELKSMQSQLVAKATDEDITTSTDLIALDFYGNMMFEAPSYFGKLDEVSTDGT